MVIVRNTANKKLGLREAPVIAAYALYSLIPRASQAVYRTFDESVCEFS